jgi:archaeosine synthase
MRFRQTIEDSGRLDAVHEVIVTSPLGLVPRELELFYPAQDYDIPVTGHWDRDEKKMAEEMVSWLVSSQKYDLVISHLGDEREPVNSVLDDFVDTSGGNPGSRESLAKLKDVLTQQVPPPRTEGMTRAVDDMRSICRFQFGGAGESLCDGAHITGRWPNLKIIRGKDQMGMLTGDRGMISLTIGGGRAVAPSGAYCVEIEDFEPKGNLFSVGVERASEDIRIGDDVAVVHARDVRAVGVARMCAAEMNLAERGEAIHIRHVR